ncbi:MAG: hypothetical protein COA63_011675 [Methylophaga sp.]|nr:hypothetical protein [Methylophaga sp.]
MDIPVELQDKKISLSSIGLSEVAWKYEDAIKLIVYFENNKIFILGGDVLVKDGDKYRHNNDNWYLDKEQGSYEDSIKKATNYIANYPKGDYAFVFVTS